MYIFIKTDNGGIKKIRMSEDRNEIEKIRLYEMIDDCYNSENFDLSVYMHASPEDFISDNIPESHERLNDKNRDYSLDAELNTQLILETNNLDNFMKWCESTGYHRFRNQNMLPDIISIGLAPNPFFEYCIFNTNNPIKQTFDA